MALEYVALSEIDTKEFRKKLGFPITKGLKYYYKENKCWYEKNIVSYESIGEYQSGSHSLRVILEDGTQVVIHSDYLAEMQKPSFMGNHDDKETVCNEFAEENKCGAKDNVLGKRVECTPKSYIVVDLETTGRNHYEDDIIEIGAIKYINNIEVDRFSALVKTPKTLSKDIIKLTGITNEILNKYGEEKANVITSFYSFLGDDIVIGHNITSFDSKFIEDAFQEVLGCHFKNDYIDTLYLARKELPSLKHHSLKYLAEIFSIDYTKAHRAVEDCIINNMVYEIIALGKKEYTNTIEEESLVSINENEISGWKEQVINALNDLILKKSLPSKSLSLMSNIGKKNGEITSYSICIYEPDLVEDKQSVERNSIVTRIVEGKLKSNPNILTIEPKNPNELKQIVIPDDATIYEPEKALPYIRIEKGSINLIPYLISSVEYALDNYVPKAASFACCARYKQCSDERKCIHKNQLYSKACEYRKNIENGKIFYGDNKNN